MPNLDLIALGLATGAVAYLISGAVITAPLRGLVEDQAMKSRKRPYWRWLHELVRCPYCVSHWLAFAATGIYRPWAVDLWRPLDFFVTSFVLVVIAMAAVVVIRLAKGRLL